MHRFEEDPVVPALGAPPGAAGPEYLQHRRPILICHPRQHGRLLPNRPAKCHRSTNVGIHSLHTQPNPSTRPRTRDPVRRPLTTLRTASPLPSSRRRDLRGAGPISPCSKLLLLPPGSTPPRSPGPSERSCHPLTCGGERPQPCAPAPPSLASCRAASPPPGPNA